MNISLSTFMGSHLENETQNGSFWDMWILLLIIRNINYINLFYNKANRIKILQTHERLKDKLHLNKVGLQDRKQFFYYERCGFYYLVV